MKLKSIFTLLFVVLLTVSCKKDEKKEGQKEAQASQSPFKVTISIKIKEDDLMCLYFKDNTAPYFTEDMALYKNLKKEEEIQDIIFELPKSAVPNDFRFDLSIQTKTQVYYVDKIHFLYGDKSFEILNKDLEKYLKPNPGVVLNSVDRAYSFKETNGNYDPFLTTTLEFYPLLETLVGYDAFRPASTTK